MNMLRRAVNVLIEPIDIQIGFRELDFFKTLSQKYKEFQTEIGSETASLNSSINGDYSLEQALEKQEDQQFEDNQIVSVLKEEVQETEYHVGQRVDTGMIFKPATSVVAIKFYCDCFKLALRDDTGIFEYPVLNFNLSNIKTDALMTFNKPFNVVQLTLKMLCLNEERILKDPFLKVNASLRMDANYFNMIVAAYQPLIEPWNLELDVLQEEEDTPLNAEVRLPDIVNVNLTLGMAMILNSLRYRVMEGREEWEDEKELIKLKEEMDGMHRTYTLSKNAFGHFEKIQQEEPSKVSLGVKRADQKQDNQAQFEIQNNTGVALLFWESNEAIEVSPKTKERDLLKHRNVFALNENQEMVVSTNMLIELRNENRRILGISDVLQDDVICVSLKLPKMETLLRVPIQLAGTFAYPLILSQKQPKKEPPPSVTLCVATRPTGRDSKHVSFQSAVLLSNNTCMSLRIYGLPVRQAPSIDDTFDSINQEEAEFELLSPNEVFRVPLRWILARHCLVVQVSHNGQNRYEVLFGDLMHCFSQQAYKHELETQMIGYNLDATQPSRNIYISCDIAAFKCLPSKDPKVPYKFLVNFNPPLCVQNLFAELGEGLLCSIQGQELIKNAGKVNRGEVQYFYDIEPYSKFCANSLYFSFRVDDENKRCFLLQESDEAYVFQSNALKLRKKEEVKAMDQTHARVRKELCKFEMYRGSGFSFENELIDDPMIYNNFELWVQYLPFNLLNTVSTNFEIQEKVFERTSAQKLVVFPDCQIVNQTQFQFHCGASKKEHHVRNSVVQPFSRTLYETSLNSKIALKTQGYQWSQKFSISTIGISGALTLTKKEQKKKQKRAESKKVDYIKSIYKMLDIGIKISTGSAPFSRTKIVTIVPRFIIANNLDFPIVYRQNGNMEFQEYVPALSHEPLQLPEIMDEVEIQLRMAYPHQEEEHCDKRKLEEEFLWSSGFSILDIEDFQVRFHREMEEEPFHKHWSYTTQLNDLKQYVRVEITSIDDATIFICLNRPKFPDFTIKNRTNATLFYQQVDTKAYYEIPKNKTVPYVWEDVTKDVKKLKISAGGGSRAYNLDKIKIYKGIVGDDGTKYTVQMKAKNYTRCLEVKQVIKQEDLWLSHKLAASNYLHKILIKRQFQRSEMNLAVKFHGIGFSFVDNEPKELLYVSLYKMTLKMSQWKEDPEHNARVPKHEDSIVGQEEEESRQSSSVVPQHSGLTNLQQQYDIKERGEEENQTEEIYTKIDFTLQHMQIDDMISERFRVIFSPAKQLKKTPFEQDDEEEKSTDDMTPFIQVQITKAQISDGQTVVEKYPGLLTAVQKMELKIDHQSMMQLLGFVSKLVGILTSEKKMRQQIKRNDSIGSYIESEEAAQNVLDLCPELRSETPLPPEVVKLNANKIYFEFLHFGALALKITLEIEEAAFQIEIDPSKGFGLSSVFYTLGTSLANISDAPLFFRELVISHTFSSLPNIMLQLRKNYVRQGMLQFYKIIGSSDLIGNPIGLVDKLGSGVFQFFNEPRKGMLKGPAQFVGGMGKGVQALVSNIVGGSFQAVSKVTGSLYGIAKNITGSKGARLKKPDHLLDGMYDGLKGGVTELASGLAGIFTKPYKRAKEEGAKGFIKGVGAGVLGAIASPFTAIFRIGFSLAAGVKGTASLLGGRKINKLGRFRHPRYFNVRNVLLTYNDDYSEAKMILASIRSGRFRSASLNFFADVKRMYKKKMIQGLVIVTGVEVILVESLKHVIFVLPLHKIKKLAVGECETQVFERSKDRYVLYLWHFGRKNKFSVVENEEYAVLDKLYSVLSPSIEK